VESGVVQLLIATAIGDEEDDRKIEESRDVGDHPGSMDTEQHLHSKASHAFVDWFLVEADQRAFMHLGLEFSRPAYERIWREAGEEPWHDGGPEQLEVFEERVRGLHERDFEWMLLGAALREAVTGFEVYLEKAREEVLRHQGRPVEVPERSPRWGTLVKFSASIGLPVDSSEVEGIRDLRHFLTHRRGELRTEAQRLAFAPQAGIFDAALAELSESRVTAAMDTLAGVVLEADRRVHLYTRGAPCLD
jgi:hypothetical protein